VPRQRVSVLVARIARVAAHRHGATVNDVLLAISAAGLHGCSASG